MHMSSVHSRQPPFLLIGLLLVTVLVYLRGLFGGFLFDDYPNIVDNDLLRLLDDSAQSWWNASFSSSAGLLRRPLSMLSFAVNVHLGGMNPAWFKLGNLGIHLLSGFLLYRLALLLLPRLSVWPTGTAMSASMGHRLALLIAALWLLHPLHVSSVLYVVQRMTLLTALFSLAALLSYSSLRQRQLAGQGGLALPFAGFLVSSVLSVASKENGALILPAVLVLEIYAFHFVAGSRRQTLWLRAGLGVFVAVPLFLALLFLASHPAWLLSGYGERDFDLTTRVLTQARVLWHYLLWTFAPNIHWMGLYHDDIAYSTSIISPATTLPALFGLAGLAVIAWWSRRRQPGIGFGIAWFLVWHTLESTVIALEMVFEHRQYLPMSGLLIGLVAALAPLIQRHWAMARRLSVAVLLGLALLTAQRSTQWGDPLRLHLAMAEHHPHSPRSLYDAGRALVDRPGSDAERLQGAETGRDYLQRSMQLSPSYVHPAATLVMTYQNQGEVPPALMHELIRRAATMQRASPLPLLLVVRAAANQRLQVRAEDVLALVNAGLENPSMDQLSRGLLLSNYGHYLVNAANQPQAAISATLAAIELEPRYALFQLNAAYLAERLGQPNLAAQHLDNAALLDGVGEYRDQITQLRQKLQAAAP